MLKQLSVKNLTLFPHEHQLQFAAGLNVFIGENGTGKTHLMKAIYSLIATSEEASRKQNSPPTKTYLQKAYADKLLGVFKPDTLGRLASRKQGRSRCELTLHFKDPVFVEMISGKVYEIAKSDWENKGMDVKFRNLPVWDSVVMVAERTQLSIKDQCSM